jgi:hypothetical protein
MAQQGEGVSIVHSTKDRDKMVLERLDSLFGDVAMVAVQGNTLMGHPVLCNAMGYFLGWTCLPMQNLGRISKEIKLGTLPS